MTLFLCGFMGCGKTALSEQLSKKLSCDSVDMDDYIVEKAGMSIPSQCHNDASVSGFLVSFYWIFFAIASRE